jgi:hypothetical protein
VALGLHSYTACLVHEVNILNYDPDLAAAVIIRILYSVYWEQFSGTVDPFKECWKKVLAIVSAIYSFQY